MKDVCPGTKSDAAHLQTDERTEGHIQKKQTVTIIRLTHTQKKILQKVSRFPHVKNTMIHSL